MNISSQIKTQDITDSASKMAEATSKYVSRVLDHDAAKKGIAAAGAGILVAALTELLWPSR